MTIHGIDDGGTEIVYIETFEEVEAGLDRFLQEHGKIFGPFHQRHFVSFLPMFSLPCLDQSFHGSCRFGPG